MEQERLRIEWLDKEDKHTLYVKFALLELARAGEIDFVRIPPARFDRKILSQQAIEALSSAQSFFVAYQNGQQCKVILDISESFFFMSSAIAEVDLYFCTAYNSELFEKRQFLTPYPWQQRYDLGGYQRNFQRIEKKFGKHFYKLTRFIPCPPVMDLPARRFDKEKQVAITSLLFARFLQKKIPGLFGNFFDPEYRLFKLRYQQIFGYRKNTLKYDIVVRESLWAWPWHRALLIKALAALKDRKVFYGLSSSEENHDQAWWRHDIPEDEHDEIDKIIHENVCFPESYEEMITSSRLAVFPTGKHWGWRAITFLSLFSGGPLLMDKPIFEPYFPMDVFKVFYTQDEWEDLETVLNQVDEEQWAAIRQHNQAAFDQYLAPLPVGKYLFQTIQGWFRQA
ncbi:MAG: hypothetical protein SD837_21415 [Candidatus Electrothrix scaldis]|nr:MAG: hypothetical protein SD837_21415 [Candidatus Electrothrix sp. GW3-3]